MKNRQKTLCLGMALWLAVALVRPLPGPRRADAGRRGQDLFRHRGQRRGLRLYRGQRNGAAQEGKGADRAGNQHVCHALPAGQPVQQRPSRSSPCWMPRRAASCRATSGIDQGGNPPYLFAASHGSRGHPEVLPARRNATNRRHSRAADRRATSCSARSARSSSKDRAAEVRCDSPRDLDGAGGAPGRFQEDRGGKARTGGENRSLPGHRGGRRPDRREDHVLARPRLRLLRQVRRRQPRRVPVRPPGRRPHQGGQHRRRLLHQDQRRHRRRARRSPT